MSAADTTAKRVQEVPYLEHEPNIPEFQNCVPPQGKVQILQIQCLFVEDVQARQGKS
jgi:hypothetical protein